MWLPTKAQVDAASRHAITIAGTAIAIFGLQAKGFDPAKVTAMIQALGPVINDIVTAIGAAGTLYAMLKASNSASPTNQIASATATAKGPASPESLAAQQGLINATSSIAQDKTLPKNEEATQTLIAATIALPSVQTIVTDKTTADAAPSPSVVAADAVKIVPAT